MDSATETALGTFTQFRYFKHSVTTDHRVAQLQTGCDIVRDLQALDVSTLALAPLLWRPLATACEVAGDVPVLFGDTGTEVRFTSLPVMMRTVLLGAAKTIYLLAPNSSIDRQVRLLRVANKELADQAKALKASRDLNAEVAAEHYKDALKTCEIARSEVAAQLLRLGLKGASEVNETTMLTEAAKTVRLGGHIPSDWVELTMMLWNDMSAVSHARAWHWDAFRDRDDAGARAIQLLVPCHAFLDTGWRLWHHRRGGIGDPYASRASGRPH